jgi:hypothetical protein
LDVRFHTRDTGPPLTSLPSDNSIKTANVDPRYNSLSRAYTIVVRRPNGAYPLPSRFAVNHVSGLFRNASAKYAQGLCPDRAAQGVSEPLKSLLSRKRPMEASGSSTGIASAVIDRATAIPN